MSKFYLFGSNGYDSAWAMDSLIGNYPTLQEAIEAIEIRTRTVKLSGGLAVSTSLDLGRVQPLREVPPSEHTYVRGYTKDHEEIEWAQVATVNKESDLVMVAQWNEPSLGWKVFDVQ